MGGMCVWEKGEAGVVNWPSAAGGGRRRRRRRSARCLLLLPARHRESPESQRRAATLGRCDTLAGHTRLGGAAGVHLARNVFFLKLGCASAAPLACSAGTSLPLSSISANQSRATCDKRLPAAWCPHLCVLARRALRRVERGTAAHNPIRAPPRADRLHLRSLREGMGRVRHCTPAHI